LWPRTLGPRSEQPIAFKVDVTENDEAYRVQAEIPGVSKEDIDVRIDGAEIAISGEVKREKDVADNDGTVLRSERVYGKMYRTFSLDQAVDHARAHAKCIDGVLELILPKAIGESAKRKRLTIN
jgi:HSP20 family protein